MQLVITEVTEMHGGHYCVAGWCSAKKLMLRPLPNGQNWTSALLDAHSISVGATVEIQVSGASVVSTYPHRTEDTPITVAGTKLISAGLATWFGPHAPPLSPTLYDAFQSCLVTTGKWDGAMTGAHVPEGAKIGSLAAVHVPFGNLTFFEGDFQGKTRLRARLTDKNGCYNLPD
jgi:hypothetical protein